MTATLDARPYIPYFPDATVIAPLDLPEEEWLALRRRGMGGSDMLTLLGLNPNAGLTRLYLDKKGMLPDIDQAGLKRAARRGKRMEGLIGEFFAEETGFLVTKAPGVLAHRREPWMMANLDFTAFDPEPTVLECKSRTWRSAKAEDWGGLEPPDGPTLQVLWYLAVTGLDKGYVAVSIDDDFRFFAVYRDEELINHMITAARRFYFEHVVAGRPPEPDGLASTAELLTHLWDVKPGSIKLFDREEVQELRDRRRALKAEAKAKEEAATKITNQLKMMLGDAEEAVDFSGKRLFGWKRDGNFPVARFAKELPEAAAQYTTQVDVVDVPRIKIENPNLYAAMRARVFRDGSN